MTGNSDGGYAMPDRDADEPPSSPRPQDRPLDAEDIRLLEAARTVFTRRGVRNTSTSEIAEAAGVTRVTLYRRLGTRDDIVRRTYAYETERLMLSINARFTPFEALEWDPVRHVEDLLVGTAFDVRDSDLLQSLVAIDRADTTAMLTTEADSVMWVVTELVAEFIRNTWTHDVHSRSIPPEEAEVLSRQIGSVVARFLHSIVSMPDGPPRLEDEDEIRVLARRTLVPLILQR